MRVDVNWSQEVSAKFPELAICVGLINGVAIEEENEELHRLKKRVYEEIKGKYNVETLKDDPTVRAYRDFYWKLDIDPTKTRPSGEALLRRVLHGSKLPNISTVVDAYNLASLSTIIPISGFDLNRLALPLETRFAKDGEVFTGIGLKTPSPLTSKMLVLADRMRVLCIYPYRDCDYAKIMFQTRNVAIVGYGAPRIAREQLKEAVQTTLSFIKQVSGGEIMGMEVLQSNLAQK